MKTCLVSGISGAGKTVFIKALEDSGFYCTDNIPIPLLPDFINFLKKHRSYDRVAFVVDIREREFFQQLGAIVDGLSSDKELGFEIIFLDARDDVLVRRYSATRRLHPLSIGHDLLSGIEEERRLLLGIRNKAAIVVDTSELNSYQLKKEAESIAFGDGERDRVTLRIISFGYKYGLPMDADFVFDVRFIQNPFYVDGLRDKTGLDSDVMSFLSEKNISSAFLDHLESMFSSIIDEFDREGKNLITIAFGCTGGRHRSVFIAQSFYERISKGRTTSAVWHRDIDRGL